MKRLRLKLSKDVCIDCTHRRYNLSIGYKDWDYADESRWKNNSIRCTLGTYNIHNGPYDCPRIMEHMVLK